MQNTGIHITTNKSLPGPTTTRRHRTRWSFYCLGVLPVLFHNSYILHLQPKLVNSEVGVVEVQSVHDNVWGTNHNIVFVCLFLFLSCTHTRSDSVAWSSYIKCVLCVCVFVLAFVSFTLLTDRDSTINSHIRGVSNYPIHGYIEVRRSTRHTRIGEPV